MNQQNLASSSIIVFERRACQLKTVRLCPQMFSIHGKPTFCFCFEVCQHEPARVLLGLLLAPYAWHLNEPTPKLAKWADSNISLAETTGKWQIQENGPESSLHPGKNEQDPQRVFYGSTWTCLNESILDLPPLPRIELLWFVLQSIKLEEHANYIWWGHGEMTRIHASIKLFSQHLI